VGTTGCDANPRDRHPPRHRGVPDRRDPPRPSSSIPPFYLGPDPAPRRSLNRPLSLASSSRIRRRNDENGIRAFVDNDDRKERLE